MQTHNVIAKINDPLPCCYSHTCTCTQVHMHNIRIIMLVSCTRPLPPPLLIMEEGVVWFTSSGTYTSALNVFQYIQSCGGGYKTNCTHILCRCTIIITITVYPCFFVTITHMHVITILLVVDLCSSLAFFMMTHATP